MVKNENGEELSGANKEVFKTIKPERRINLDGVFYQYFNNLCITADGLTQHPHITDVRLEFSEFGQDNETDSKFVFKLEGDANLNDIVIRYLNINGYLGLLFKNVLEQICVLFSNRLVNFYNSKEDDEFIILSVKDVYFSQEEQTITCQYQQVLGKAVVSTLFKDNL